MGLTCFVALIKERVNSPNGIRDMFLFGKRLNAQQSLELGIVDSVGAQAELLPQATELAKSICSKSSKRDAFGRLKQSTYKHVLEALAKRPSISLPSKI